MSTRSALDKLYRRDRGVCHWCGRLIPRYQATRDHLLPRSQTKTMSDIVLACASCNNDRANRPPEHAEASLEKRRDYAYRQWLADCRPPGCTT